MNTRSSEGRHPDPQNLVCSSEQKKSALNSHVQKKWQPKRRLTQAFVSPERELMGLDPEANAHVVRQRALSEARCGHFQSAIALFDQLLIANPYSARDYNNRGLVYFQSGHLEMALADYNQALLLNPYLDGAYNNRANYYAAIGLYLEAILDYDAALDLNPDNVRAWINQGITFRDLQMFDRAIESLETALTLGHLESHIYAERGRTYHLRGDWNCAIADYQRALGCIDDPCATALGNDTRLRHQIHTWMEELLAPLHQN